MLQLERYKFCCCRGCAWLHELYSEEKWNKEDEEYWKSYMDRRILIENYMLDVIRNEIFEIALRYYNFWEKRVWTCLETYQAWQN